jgi:hypothetical protein
LNILADLHGCFRDSLVALPELLNETYSTLHRRNNVCLAYALWAQRRIAREVSCLASSVRDLSDRASPCNDLNEVTLTDAFVAATAAVATTIFSGLSSTPPESVASAAPSLHTRRHTPLPAP